MALEGAYVVVHVQRGIVSFCEPYDNRAKAEADFEEQKKDYNAMDDQLQLLDGEGLLIDEAGYEDDPDYEEDGE